MTSPVMSHRERVLAALNHEEPDRVPLDFGSTRETSIHRAGYERLKRHFGINSETVIIDRVQQCVLVDAEVLERFDVDLRPILPKSSLVSPEVEIDEFSYRDQWGVLRSKAANSRYYDLVESPLSGNISLQDIVNHPWPDPDDRTRFDGLREEALRLKQEGGYALVLGLSIGAIHTSQFLRGFEDWYVDMATNPRLIGALIDAILDVSMTIASNAMNEVGDLVDIVHGGDDLGTQRGLQVSPDTYREVIKPHHARFFAQIHDMCPHAKVALHSCGSIYPLIGDLIDIGLDVLNPVQVSAVNMNPVALKREFGDHLSFWGAVDSQDVLPFKGTNDVREEVRRRIQELGGCGGYILAPVHNVQPDVPVDNIIALYESGKEYGTYPRDNVDRQ